MLCHKLNRSWLCLLLCLILSSLLVNLAWADSLQVKSAILMDAATGKVLYAQNADRKIPPASLTKVMSMFLALEAVAKKKVGLQQRIKVSFNAANQTGSRMHLRPYERVSFERLLQGMAVSSGNDASMAVAEHLSKSGKSRFFVQAMNAKARALGMTNTLFINPHGLPAAKQVTTARDMAKLSQAYLAKFPNALRFHKMQGLKHNGRVTTNKNPLLQSFPGADGLKTGWVTASGYNLISTVKRGKSRLIAVVLGASNPEKRAYATTKLLEAGFKSLGTERTVSQVLENKPALAEAEPEKIIAPRKNTVKKKNTQIAKKSKTKKKPQIAKKTTKKKPQIAKKTINKKTQIAKKTNKKAQIAKKTNKNPKPNLARSKTNQPKKTTEAAMARTNKRS